MIHHHSHVMHPPQLNQPPPQHIQQPNMPSQPNQQRMNHHHYQQRLNHQQIQQQLPPPQIHGQRPTGLPQQPPQHTVPPPIHPKQHLHQNIATLNQKPLQHGTTSQNQQIQSSQRFSYEKSSIQPSLNLKRESANSVSATATLVQNNSSIVTSHQQHQQHPPQNPSSASSHPASHHLITSANKYHQPPPSLQPSQLHHHPPPSLQASHNNVTIISSSDKSTADLKSSSTTPVVSANIKDIILSNDKENGETLEGIESLENTKEKTPMCLVNELARYNKIQHQYRLIGEQGPAHKKRFTVILKLGDEEYAAEGLSIKKAQHAAAKEAILKTCYKHPPLKTNRQKLPSKNSGNITPTVELNALAMKRGEPTVYNVTSQPNNVMHGMPPSTGQPFNPNLPPPSQGSQFNPRNGGGSNVNSLYPQRRFPNQRSAFPTNNRYSSHFSETFHVTLHVGNRQFTGMGPTAQAARHDAAARALEVLKPLTCDVESAASVKSMDNSSSDDTGNESLLNDIKSPISIVHELALKRKMVVSFEVQSEKGPPHMKVYSTLCKVGTIVTEGEGNGKKLSKKKAAEKMVDELKKLPPLSPVEETPKLAAAKGRARIKPPLPPQAATTPIVKKKSRNLIKEKLEVSNTDEINPISQLIQIQQGRKEKEPVYTVVDERGTARRREFVIEVAAGGLSASGTGPNKKQAKRIAAENLLILMGINRAPSNLSSETAKETVAVASAKLTKPELVDKSKKVQFIPDADASKKPPAVKSSVSGNPRQLAPGLLLVPSTTESNFTTPSKATTTQANNSSSHSSPETAGNEKSSTASPGSNHDSGIGESGVSPRDQLGYLATLLGITVGYSDFPKGNHSEFLSLVTLSTDPPHMSHGSGATVDESRDNAASTALNYITELGLDNVKPKAK